MNTKIRFNTFLGDQTLGKDRGCKQGASQTASSEVSGKDIPNDQELLFIGNPEAHEGGKSPIHIST